jgi:8-oxo-dGTP diphosphatase
MTSPAAPAPLHVMAGVLCDPQGRLLLCERPPGKHLAGLWEFPGGKLEPGESPRQGLCRELHEELGIRVLTCTPFLALPWTYDALSLLLDTWLIDRWEGVPRSVEGQALRWCLPLDIDAAQLAPADRVILQQLLCADASADSANRHS